MLRYVSCRGHGSGHCAPIPEPSWRWAPSSPSWTVCADAWGRIDYIHGADVVGSLRPPRAISASAARHGQGQLFPTVIHDGCSPQDLLHGEAQDKRFYLEARRIR